MFPYMAESCVGVLVDDSTVRAKGQLLPFPGNSKGLPRQAISVMEVRRNSLSGPNTKAVRTAGTTAVKMGHLEGDP